MNTSTPKPQAPYARPEFFLLVLVLLLPLISIPGPSMVTGHPWKVELAVSIAILAVLTWFCATSSENSFVKLLFSSNYGAFGLGSLTIFTLWSGISVFWADAIVSVGHHTAVWFLYTAVFSIALIYLLKNRSLKALLGALGLVSVIVFGLCVFDYLSITKFEFVEGTLRIRYAKYGEMLAAVAPLLFAFSLYQRKGFANPVWIVTGGAAWMVAMLSLSKGAFVAGIAGFALLFVGALLFGRAKIRKRVLRTATIWLAITVFMQVFFAFYSSLPATTQYLSGEADHDRQTSTFRLFTWKIGTSMALSNPIIGVGADNFGTSFNEARRNYFANRAFEENRAASAEDFMVERAHNEPLQVFAELGIIGLFLFALIALSFAIPLFARLRQRRSLSPLAIGAAAGMSAFAVSSMFSSFSFRAMQNGIVFMLILAIGIYELTKHERDAIGFFGFAFRRPALPAGKWLMAATALICVVFNSLIGLSNLYTYFGQSEKDPGLSRSYFKTAITLNPENGAAYYLSGVRAFLEKRPHEALPLLEESRKYGAGATLNYFYTASSHVMNNDRDHAAAVLADAVKIYPQSVYARVHYSVLLRENGRAEEADRQYTNAYRIGKRQAETWKRILEDDLLKATDATRNRPDLDKPSELAPQNIIESVFHISRLDQAKK